jgi:hypothetical protein
MEPHLRRSGKAEKWGQNQASQSSAALCLHICLRIQAGTTLAV